MPALTELGTDIRNALPSNTPAAPETTTATLETADPMPTARDVVIAAAAEHTESGLDDSFADAAPVITSGPAVTTSGDPGLDSADIALPETPSTTNLWVRLRDGLNLDHRLEEPRVQAELAWFARHPEYLDRVANRASRYLYYIVNEVEARGMPMEVALLPIVESAFDPFAYSHGRASGLWQFIPGTARMYGMQMDYWHDGRRDVRRATQGALTYLAHLHSQFDNDWYLALASYNSGQGNVRNSVKKNLRAGKSIDFFELDLFRETAAYVPRLLAISALVADPEKYNVTLLPITNSAYFETVNIGSQLDLAVAAKAADLPIDELYRLNPAYNKWSTHPEGPHELLVPIAKAAGFRDALTALPTEDRLGWRRHKVRNGESLGVIARRYNTSVATLRTVNKLNGTLIRAGQSLMIPVARSSSATYELSAEARLASRQQSVAAKTGATPLRYTVRNGDSFWKIARRHDVPMRALAKWNGMATTDLLTPGKELVIFNAAIPAAVADITAPPDNNAVIRKIDYRVRNGESLGLIASKFNLSIADIKQWNSTISRQKYLQPGDRITLYVDVTDTH